MDKNYIVTKSNTLITANYDLSLQEQKLILTLASMVQPTDEEFKEYKFKIKDFMTLLGIETQTKYTEIPKITRELMKKVFEIKEGKDIIQLSWLSSARYKTGEGLVILKFDSSLKPYMLQLKELYTCYKLENILSLKSKYSLRLFEILKSNQFKTFWEINLEEFKKLLGANEKSYSIYQNVKNRILIKAQKELKEKTDIYFDFEEIKTGRKVTSIKFLIKSNKKATAPKKKKPVDEIAVDIIEGQQNIDDIANIKKVQSIIPNLKDTDAIAILKVATNDLKLIKEKYGVVSNLKKITSLTGAMIDAIKYDWINQEVNNNSFNNFKAREYDYDKLEKKLLGYSE